MSVPARVLNDLFSAKLDTAEGKEKVAQMGSVYIRDRLREVCFGIHPSPQRLLGHADLRQGSGQRRRPVRLLKFAQRPPIVAAPSHLHAGPIHLVNGRLTAGSVSGGQRRHEDRKQDDRKNRAMQGQVQGS